MRVLTLPYTQRYLYIHTKLLHLNINSFSKEESIGRNCRFLQGNVHCIFLYVSKHICSYIHMLIHT